MVFKTALLQFTLKIRTQAERKKATNPKIIITLKIRVPEP